MREGSENRWQENRLLASLPERDRSRLTPQLEFLTLFARQTVHENGEEMNFVYFPLDCIVALISSVEHDATVEVGVVLKKDAKRSSRMRELMLTYANALLAQSAQLAACHRYHTPQARLARLLLMINDRMQTSELRITQELLARLLGTRRATVTEAANHLQDAGLIQSVRGRIRFLNTKGLEAKACSCYGIITAQQDEIKLRPETF